MPELQQRLTWSLSKSNIVTIKWEDSLHGTTVTYFLHQEKSTKLFIFISDLHEKNEPSKSLCIWLQVSIIVNFLEVGERVQIDCDNSEKEHFLK